MRIRIEFDNPSGIIDAVMKTVEAEANKVATDLHAGLMLATPVDTGRARNGWQLELGAMPVVENQVPYIGVLNDGHSKQAPALFIEAEIARVTKP